jgi:hypothetical protein
MIEIEGTCQLLVYTDDKLLGKHKYRKEKHASKGAGREIHAEKIK